MRNLVPQVNFGLSAMDPSLSGAALAQQTQQRIAQTHAQDLANEAAARKMPFLIPSLQQQINQARARTAYVQQLARTAQFKAAHPLVGQPGVAGQIGAMLLLEERKRQEAAAQYQNHPQIPETWQEAGESANLGLQNRSSPLNISDQIQPGDTPSQVLAKSIATDLNSKAANAKLAAQRATYYKFKTEPIDVQNWTYAMAQSAGYTPSEITDRIAKGQGISQMLADKGLHINDVTPIYRPTRTTLGRMQQRNSAIAEINALNPKLNSWIAPFVGLGQLSPVMAWRQIQNHDPDQIAKYIAARSLVPELTSLRAKAMSGPVGIETLREIQNATYGHMNLWRAIVPPKVFKMAQDYADKTLNEAVSASNEQLLKKAPIMPKDVADREIQLSQSRGEAVQPVQIPTSWPGKTDAEKRAAFQQWYRTLSPSQQQSVRQQLRAQ